MNVKKLVCSIISLSLLVNCGIAALPVSASAVDTDTEIYVSPDGNDSNSGSSESPFKTLNELRPKLECITAICPAILSSILHPVFIIWITLLNSPKQIPELTVLV